jgi:hypothetical protein
MVDAAAEVARDGGVKDDNIILERYLPTGCEAHLVVRDHRRIPS